MAKFFTDNPEDLKEAAAVLKDGGVGILPTDTLYGIVGCALNQKAVEKIYTLKKRSPDKPFIILISKISDLELFNIFIDQKIRQFLKHVWPGQLSVILPCPEESFSYLHRGNKSLAFRLSDHQPVLEVLSLSGPLVAPSVNFENELPALDIKQAKKYFDNQVDFYMNAGKLDSQPSTLIKIEGLNVQVLRQGEIKIKQTAI